MTDITHQGQVGLQFGSQAAAYVESPVHAQGDDLLRLAGLAADLRPRRALDLGCGGGHAAYAIAPHAGRTVAFDLSAEMLAAVAAQAGIRGLAGIRPVRGTVDRLPFADGLFDLLVSRYSAHHWQHFPRALQEARRVLAPGGTAAFIDIVAPAAPLLDSFLQTVEVLRDPSHVRDHRPEEWRAALQQAGFAVSPPETWRLRLDFASWVQRMNTPDLHRRAIRSLQGLAADEVKSHFAVEADGSFTLDVMLIIAT